MVDRSFQVRYNLRSKEGAGSTDVRKLLGGVHPTHSRTMLEMDNIHSRILQYQRRGAGVILESMEGLAIELSLQFGFSATNN